MSNKDIIDKINDLYILGRKKYLIMNNKGQYSTINYDKEAKKKGNRPLVDSMVKEHLQGKRTIGVFSFYYSKFVCFDVDVKNAELAKWTVYKLIDTLQNLGISEDYINISTSGNKGYHVEIFFTKPVQSKALKDFYLLVLNSADLLNIDFGQVELRPTDTQGVKLPLGKHFKTGNRCWFVDWVKGLKPIENKEFVLTIKKLDSEYFYSLFNKAKDTIDIDEAEEVENIIQSHKPLKIYKQNIDEDITVEAIEKLIKDGLTMQGTRHNSLLKIAKYNKHNGMSAEDNEEFLIDWMSRQDKRTYTTKWKDVLKDINLIIQYTYEKNYQLTIKSNDISVSAEELQDILKVKGKNQKVILYSLLIHSKRYCNKDGIFYMSYKQMQEVTGISKRNLIRLVQQLEELKVIDVFRSNNMTYNKRDKKPISEVNKYKYNLLGDKLYNTENGNIFNVCNKNCTNCFNACLCNLYEDKELKELLSRRNYEEIKTFRNNDYIKLPCIAM